MMKDTWRSLIFMYSLEPNFDFEEILFVHAWFALLKISCEEKLCIHQS